MKSGRIADCCQPNALITLKEYLVDYASPETRRPGAELIERELGSVGSEAVRAKAAEYIRRIESGARDFRF